jgi:predicted ribosome quality control (RQC) complex YloA/Tae2 family protein
MPEIELDLKKSVEQNASAYFDKAKKLKKKVIGATQIVGKLKLQVSDLEKKQQSIETMMPKVQRKKAWFEKFRWFISSEGFLVIGGRDATTNEIIIKKHTDNEDIVFHTDMAGSPFFVVKTEGKKPGQETLQEAADATFSFSRAGKSDLTTSPVFYVLPEQVSKTPNPGEYLPKGAFVIRGKTSYVNNRFNVAIGLYDGAPMSGPIESISKNCGKFVAIVPGSKKPSDIAKMVRKLIGGELDEIIRSLPSGSLDIKK